MKKYFFDVHNTRFTSVDDDGRECADQDEVGAEALRVLCAIAQDDPLQHLNGRLGAVVRDADNHVVLTATVSLSTLWVGDA